MKRDTPPAPVAGHCEWMDWLGSGLLKAPMVVRPMPAPGLADPTSASPVATQATAPMTVLTAASPMPVLMAAHIPQLLLPSTHADANANANADASRYTLARASIAHATGHLRYSTPGQATTGLKPLAIVMVSALEDARVDLLTMRDYPGVRAWFMRCWDAVPASEGLDFASLMQRLGRALLDPACDDRNPWVQQARARFDALADLTDAAACRRIASVLANELGQMRVPFDAQQPYVVPVAYRDDNSYLWTFDKTAADTTATIAADMEPPAKVAGGAGRAPQDVQPDPQPTATYPEWDHRMGHLRQAWCTVCERPAPLDATAPPASRLRNAHLAAPRQRTPARSRPSRDGDTPHLDAAITALLDLRLQSTPPDAVFVRDAARRTRRDDASVLMLLDLSESTNDAFDDSRKPGPQAPDAAGRTVLALEKEAARQLASRHTARGARVAVHGFHSHTRGDVGYYRLLDFGQPLDAAALHRIASVRASLSTRTGAALRHATACLTHERSRQRSILLVSDGAPSDVDVFTSGQLAQDATHAMQEARRQGITVRCLAIGTEAGRELRRMAGPSSVATVTSPRTMASQIARHLARW
jgi:hypothetical protein